VTSEALEIEVVVGPLSYRVRCLPAQSCQSRLARISDTVGVVEFPWRGDVVREPPIANSFWTAAGKTATFLSRDVPSALAAGWLAVGLRSDRLSSFHLVSKITIHGNQ